MSDAQNLNEFFDAVEAPARDTRFRLGVMERVARRRLTMKLAIDFGLFAALALSFWLVAPALGNALAAKGSSLVAVVVTLACVAMVAMAGRWLLRRPGAGSIKRSA